MTKYAEAIGAAVDLEWEIVSVARVADWLDKDAGRIAVLTIASELEASVIDGQAFQGLSYRIVVAVPSLTEIEARRYLAAGVGGIVDRSESPEVISAAIEATAAGYVMLPAQLAYQVAGRIEVPPSDIDQQCVVWLQERVDGASVRDMADKYAYSTRELHRRFTQFYAEIGVTGMLEAIVLLTRYGLVH